MTYPHTKEFRLGTQVVFIGALVAGILGTALPVEPLTLRIGFIPIAFSMVGFGFAGGWLIAHFLRIMLGWLSPSLARGLGLLYFYGGPIGAVLLPLFSAFETDGSQGQEVSLAEMLLLVPAALGVSAGVRQVLNQHFVAV